MNHLLIKSYSAIIVVLLILLSCQESQKANKTNDISGEYYDWTKTLKPEQPWIRDYNKTIVMKFFLCDRDSLGNASKVYLSFSDALDVVKRIDNLTLGIPKIVYLVGWQFNGHDSKYPSWDEVNERLKRPQDITTLETLKWLFNEAKAYNTTISLHINMLDAFKDSPLWDEYYAKNIIAKDSLGNPIKGEVFGGMQSYQLSYTQEWKLGYAQKRIDKLIEMIPELTDAGTIHIDAFHSMRPSGVGEPISPYLGYSIDDEIATQRKIFRYWRKKGIDVTCEGGKYWLRIDPFLGLQALSWHYDERTFAKEDWLNKPKNFTALPSELCCYTPMQAESAIRKDPVNLPGLIEEFCLKAVPWYYKRNGDVSKAGTTIISDDEVICPALWRDRTIVAYSKTGFSTKKIRVPSNWVGVKQVKVSLITLNKTEEKEIISVNDGVILLSLGKNEPMVITAL
jgi:hypothetical protein